VEQARRGGIRVIGPDSLGVMSPMTGLNATVASAMAKPGKIAFLSQSGALGTAILDWSIRAHVGFSAFVSVGEMLDVGWSDLIAVRRMLGVGGLAFTVLGQHVLTNAQTVFDGGTFDTLFNQYVEVSGFRYQTSAKESDDVTRLSKGKLATILLQLSLVGRFPLNPMVVPYVLAGGGYYLNTFDLDGNIVGNWSDLGFDDDEKVDNAFGFHVGAGLDYFINPNIAVGVNGRYCIVKGKGSWLLRDQVTGEEIKGNLANLSLNSIILVLSLKYFF
jgi:opacity protein-like surface antigen